jgi:hypothetical protein
MSICIYTNRYASKNTLFFITFTPNLGRVLVHLSLTVDKGNVDESSSVQESLLGSANRGLGLLLLLDLGSLRLDLTGTSDRTVLLSLWLVYDRWDL